MRAVGPLCGHDESARLADVDERRPEGGVAGHRTARRDARDHWERDRPAVYEGDAVAHRLEVHCATRAGARRLGVDSGISVVDLHQLWRLRRDPEDAIDIDVT